MGILGQIRSLTIPDNAQLGARLFVTDGVNHNWVYDGLHDDPRPMGAEPQRDSLNATLSSGGSLEAGAIYTYGVRRVIKSGRLEIPGSTTTATVQTDDTNRTVTVELQDYQETIPDGAHWSVHYQVLRSLANATDTLYLVEELDQSGYDALSGGAYEDSGSDDSLDTGVSVPLDKIRNLRIPPVRFITSWQGMLLAGGSAAYSEGGVSGSAGSATVTVVGPGEVTEADRRANLWVAGEDRVFRITEVDTANAQYTLDADLAADHTEETEWQRWHDHDTVFITPPVPGDIEGYTLGEEIITQRDAGNKLTGLAAGSAGVYAFRESSVEFITGDKNGVGVMPHPYSPPGCASHATIASEHMPGVIYYAGHQGVWRISDSEAQKISRPVDPIIRGHVDHTVDKYTHGIYDPVSGLYFLWLFEYYWLPRNGNRIPALCLIYDTFFQCWYRARIPANASGVWRNESGRLQPVIGIADTIADLWTGDSDGVEAAGTVSAGISEGALRDTDTDFQALGVSIGQSIYLKHGDGTIEERIVSRIADSGTVEIFGQWESAPVSGESYRIGSIRWSAETRETGGGSWSMSKKIESVYTAHDLTDRDVATVLYGPRGHGEIEEVRNWNEKDIEKAAASRAGLRTQTLQMKYRGETAPVEILGVEAVLTDTHA